MIAWWLLSAAAASLLQDPTSLQRDQMVARQIEARGVKDRAVIRAMRSTPRHLFVPEDVRAAAYQDRPLPIAHGQTISQPYIVAVMTELLQVNPKHRVLEIGTGSGYQAAILSPLAAQVFTIEIVPELARSSAALLAKLGHRNVTVRHGDGYKGWPEHAPFDRIILTASPPEIPKALLDQLKPGGILVSPEGKDADNQELIVIEKSTDGKLSRRSIFAVRFVPMIPAP